MARRISTNFNKQRGYFSGLTVSTWLCCYSSIKMLRFVDIFFPELIFARSALNLGLLAYRFFIDFIKAHKSMEQNCSSNSSDYERIHFEWIALEAGSLFLTLLSLYFFAATIAYNVMQNRQLPSNSSSKQKLLEKLHFVAMLSSHGCILLGLVAIQLPMFSKHDEDSNVCSIFSLVETWSHQLSLCSIFTMLWLRIKLFYCNQIMRTLQTTFIRVVGYVILFIVVIFTAQFGVVFSLFHTSKSSCYYCRSYSIRKAIFPSIILLTIFDSACIITLAILLVYPLRANQNQMSDISCKHIRSLLKRILKRTLLCLGVYAIAPLLAIVINNKNIVF